LKDVPCNRGTAPYIPVDSNGWKKWPSIRWACVNLININFKED
jgi:hypothetical protein